MPDPAAVTRGTHGGTMPTAVTGGEVHEKEALQFIANGSELLHRLLINAVDDAGNGNTRREPVDVDERKEWAFLDNLLRELPTKQDNADTDQASNEVDPPAVRAVEIDVGP